MKPFNIFIAYVKWGGGGKSRPVLVLCFNNDIVKVYQITTQYENKSLDVRSKYFEIKDWKQAGLDRHSYIDTNDTFDLPKRAIKGNPVGQLTASDKSRFFKFIS